MIFQFRNGAWIPISDEGLRGILHTYGMAAEEEKLCSLPVVLGNQSTQLLLALDSPITLRNKGVIQNIIVPPHSPMWPSRVVMDNPSLHDVIRLVTPKTHNVIQGLLFKGAYPEFDIRGTSPPRR